MVRLLAALALTMTDILSLWACRRATARLCNDCWFSLADWTKRFGVCLPACPERQRGEPLEGPDCPQFTNDKVQTTSLNQQPNAGSRLFVRTPWTKMRFLNRNQVQGR